MVELNKMTIDELSTLTGKILTDVSYTNEISTILDVVTEEQNSEILTLAAISSLKKVRSFFLYVSYNYK